MQCCTNFQGKAVWVIITR